MFDWVVGLGSGVVGYVIPFLFVLTIVVFFHELGHFLVARWCGVKVNVFSVGFGPEIVGFNDRKGTRWRLSLIPLGGYVRFEGDDNEASVPDRAALAAMPAEQRAQSFAAKSVGARAAVVAAGPIANFILAIVIFTLLFTFFGKPEMQARVDKLVEGGVAQAAGFEVGDVILAIDGEPISTFEQVQRIVSFNPDVPLDVVVERGGEPVEIFVTPRRGTIEDRFGNKQSVGLLGIERTADSTSITIREFSPPQAVVAGVEETWFVMSRTVVYLGRIIAGTESASELRGPVGVGQVAGQVATLGIPALINLAAILSVSIGLLNLVPIPMLDGGHLLYYAIEAVRGRPLSERVQEVGFRIGLVLVLVMMVYVTKNDIFRNLGL